MVPRKSGIQLDTRHERVWTRKRCELQAFILDLISAGGFINNETKGEKDEKNGTYPPQETDDTVDVADCGGPCRQRLTLYFSGRTIVNRTYSTHKSL